MKKTRTWIKVLGVGTVALASLAGCGDKNGNGQPDSVNTATAGQVASNEATAASNEASGAGGAVNNAVTAAGTTPAIKTALGANAALKGTSINVDTTADSVTLSGTVKNAAQSKVAESIAKQKAGSLKVVNNLKVTGGASPVMSKSGGKAK
ncbi:MAG: BON domain-containing protein [Abitibacteriaceae bacterium]|nr:BON domain-containing protein [Abditibacteriaceae bacterium]MBV9864876.1 BON domain-containing protein [Abditibacteriaceae bacterium]